MVSLIILSRYIVTGAITLVSSNLRKYLLNILPWRICALCSRLLGCAPGSGLIPVSHSGLRRFFHSFRGFRRPNRFLDGKCLSRPKKLRLVFPFVKIIAIQNKLTSFAVTSTYGRILSSRVEYFVYHLCHAFYVRTLESVLH